MRETFGKFIGCAAQFCFACVLFLSPLAYCREALERRNPFIYSSYTDFFLYPHDFFLVACLLLGVSAILIQKRAFQRGPSYLTLPLSLLIGFSWLGVVTGIDSQLVAYYSLRLSLFFGLYLFLVNFNPAPLWVALPLALGVVRESIVAVLQFQTQTSVGLHAWGELDLNPLLDGTSIVRDGALRVLRARGLAEHPNLLGGFLLLP